MSIDTDDFNIVEGNQKQLIVEILPANATYPEVTWESSNEDAVTVDENGLITAVAKGSATVKCTLVNNIFMTSTVEISVLSDGQGFVKTPVNATVQDLNRDYSVSSGNQNVLIVPIHLQGSIGDYSGTWDIEQLELVSDLIFDESDPTSYVSYYSSVSQGRLTMGGEVSEVYNSDYTVSELMSGDTGYNKVLQMFTDAVEWVGENDSTVDIIDDYDKDSNGYVDNIHFIVDGSDSDQWSSNLWPHMSQTGNYPSDIGEMPAVNTYSLSNLGHLEDSYTTIHEQGHMFGLQDYYDYTQGSYFDLIGMADMQDIGILDWNIYSKMNMGWVDPYYFDGSEDSSTITIEPAATSGDAIVLGQNWNGNAFDEYITIELFSDVGVNNLMWYDFEEYSNLGTGGIRISHVDSRLIGYSYDESTSQWNYEKANSVFDEGYDAYGLRYSNSYDSSDYNGYVIDNDNYKLLQVIEADGNNQFGVTHQDYYPLLSSSDFFKSGDTFSMSEYSNFFHNRTTLNNGDEFPYEVEFVEVTSDSATITINKI